MAYILSTGVILGSGKTSLAIGYKLLDINNTVLQAFTTTNVIETNVPGNYTVTGGISAPDGFQGRIVWGLSGQDLAETWLNPIEIEKNYVADSVLTRSVSHSQGTAELASLVELILAAIHSNVSGSTLTIEKTDNTTFNTRTLSADPSAIPVTGIN